MLSLLVTVVLVLEEEVLVGAVGSEGDGGPAQAGEGALKTVPSSEGAGVAPGLAVEQVRPVHANTRTK